MFHKIIVSVVVSFILRQMEQFGANFNWQMFEQDMEARIRLLVPGAWFDDAAVDLMHKCLEVVRNGLRDQGSMQAVLSALAHKDMAAAGEAIRALLMSALSSGAFAAAEEKDLQGHLERMQFA